MKSHKSDIRKKEEPLSKRVDTLFESIRQNMEEMERAFARPWPPSFELRFPTLPFPSLPEVRAPLCDLVDRGDRYELSLEVPGIEKEKIDIKATKHSIEVSGEQSEKKEEKGKNYLYNERSYKSFYRKIPVPEEIVPSKIDAKVVNGILQVAMPKKTPTPSEESTKVEVK
ncbi:MAG: Hsp20/alpha crystallin family protein [Nitrososphaera sp.]|uniref:Hsp20/alpha crystallin family protein n=1 Tax=Nitrososphaera sp. TaxID=1971748 RepID=UPI00316D3E0B